MLTKNKIVWAPFLTLIWVHLGGVYGLYLTLTQIKWASLFYLIALIMITTEGVLAGSDRLWSHKAYKAKLPLRILLALFHTLSFQGSVYFWARDHIVHHKYSDTNADPHNSTRGFWFSHMGWIIQKKEPEMVAKGKEMEVSDLKADAVVMFQNKYYWPLTIVFGFMVSATIPWYYWNEPFWNAVYACCVFRVCYVLNGTCLINSIAHMWGNKPYDRNICAAQNPIVTFLRLVKDSIITIMLFHGTIGQLNWATLWAILVPILSILWRRLVGRMI